MNPQADDNYYQPEGLFNLSALKSADVMVSRPRFVGVDHASLGIDYVPPASSLPCCQQWRIFVEPRSGVAMGKDIATQINFRTDAYGAFRNFHLPAGIMPVAWTQDHVVLSDEQADDFKSGASLASAARLFAFIGGPLIFLCCLGCIVLAYFRDRRNGGAFEEMQEGTVMY